MRQTIMMLGVAMAMAAPACGGEAGGDNLARFVGTWRPVSGTVTTTCPGYPPYTDPVATNVVWSEGVGADLVSTEGVTSCATMANVTSATASGVPGQSCTFPDAEGGTYTVTVAGYTFVLAPDSHTATENASGQVAYVGGGLSVVCSFTGSASYQKIAN